MCATDPMHSFLLGMVCRETELNFSLLSFSQRQEFIRRLKSVRMLYDVGRLPSNIFDNVEGGIRGITAAQWKLYIICYARPCLYKLIPDREYKCISEIVTMIASPIFTLDEVAKLLQDHHNLFCRLYGIWAMTVNYHMSLHLPDFIKDLGPPQSFWCFGYERLNGILAGMPNSRRNIEVEFANRFMRDVSFSNCDILDIYTSGIPTSLQKLKIFTHAILKLSH